MPPIVDAIINPVDYVIGAGIKALGVKDKTLDFLQAPISTFAAGQSPLMRLAGNKDNPKPPEEVATAPLPPSPEQPEVQADMTKASQVARRRGTGRAANYLVNKNYQSSSLLDQPGTFFSSSLGG